MKSAYELLMSCPTEQTKRCQIVVNAISEGRWADAAFTLRNVEKEVEDGEWKNDVSVLAAHCENNAATCAA